MPKYSIETQIEIEIDGDEEEALTVTDRLLQRFHDQGVVTQGEPEWHYVLFDDCVHNLTAEEDAMATPGTCKHCGRRIVNNLSDGWVDPEADGDDRIWRETCDRHETFEARHEPGTYVLHYTSDDGLPSGTWSVYREEYPERSSDEPIDGTQIRVSTWPDEATADAEANRLQADYLTSIA